MKCYTKRGSVLAALACFHRAGEEWVPLKRLRKEAVAAFRASAGDDPRPGDDAPEVVEPLFAPLKRKPFARLIADLTAAGLVVTDADDGTARITQAGLAALGLVWDRRPVERPLEYHHLTDLRMKEVGDTINKFALGGWRVVTLTGYYAGRDSDRSQDDVRYWALLERPRDPDNPPDRSS